ncbi:uncharacterized protein G2W53_031008 [Senna tora]|uniref:Uncharacterized protein n=1 Tax=Senna tora TaxID=362788 RepID=A0A834WHB2_9FABA|nr:uncharacterized protein G2W53_031008 [Senna tora]
MRTESRLVRTATGGFCGFCAVYDYEESCTASDMLANHWNGITIMPLWLFRMTILDVLSFS